MSRCRVACFRGTLRFWLSDAYVPGGLLIVATAESIGMADKAVTVTSEYPAPQELPRVGSLTPGPATRQFDFSGLHEHSRGLELSPTEAFAARLLTLLGSEEAGGPRQQRGTPTEHRALPSGAQVVPRFGGKGGQGNQYEEVPHDGLRDGCRRIRRAHTDGVVQPYGCRGAAHTGPGAQPLTCVSAMDRSRVRVERHYRRAAEPDVVLFA